MAVENPSVLVDIREDEGFARYRERVEKALAFAESLTRSEECQSQEEANRIADAVRSMANVRTDADKARLAASADYRATTDAINAHYKELLAPLKGAEEALKRKGLGWQKRLEALAREEARRRQEEQDREAERKAQEAQEAAELAAEDSEDEELKRLADETREEAAAAAVAPPVSVPAPPSQVRGDFGRLGSRKVYRFEVIDESLVPDAFKVVDRGLISARIKAEAASVKRNRGASFNLEIPGVRIWQDDVAVSR